MLDHKDGSINHLVGIQSKLRQLLSAPNDFKPTHYTQSDFEISK